MERVFDIDMRVPLGRRTGVLRLVEKDGKLCGTLEALGSCNAVTGTLGEDGQLEISGQMRSRLRAFSYHAHGQITGHTMELTVAGDRYTFPVTGVERTADDKEESV